MILTKLVHVCLSSNYCERICLQCPLSDQEQHDFRVVGAGSSLLLAQTVRSDGKSNQVERHKKKGMKLGRMKLRSNIDGSTCG